MERKRDSFLTKQRLTFHASFKQYETVMTQCWTVTFVENRDGGEWWHFCAFRVH